MTNKSKTSAQKLYFTTIICVDALFGNKVTVYCILYLHEYFTFSTSTITDMLATFKSAIWVKTQNRMWSTNQFNFKIQLFFGYRRRCILFSNGVRLTTVHGHGKLLVLILSKESNNHYILRQTSCSNSFRSFKKHYLLCQTSCNSLKSFKQPLFIVPNFLF